MKTMRGMAFFATLAASLFSAEQAHSRVYKNIKIGNYGASIHIDECYGQTFLQCMKKKVNPAIIEQAQFRSNKKHIDGVKRGEGVELRLTRNVSTYHVKYKAYWEDKAERSGRSFSAVGFRGRRAYYVADASYKHYLDSLEREILGSRSKMEQFYRAILPVITNSDASGFEGLNYKIAEVAADFVAVYIAEQYRHMIGGDGLSLGRRHNWDDALFQVTLLAAFHAGQWADSKAMFFEGEFTDVVYDQFACVYKQYDHRNRTRRNQRAPILRDYWQFNRKCDRSGVNVTRRDFQSLGGAITDWYFQNDSSSVSSVAGAIGGSARGNIIKAISGFFIRNSAPVSLSSRSDRIVDAIVEFLLTLEGDAASITSELLDE